MAVHFRAPYLGIDLGTTYTQVYLKHKGIIISEPTLVVVEGANKKLVHAVGDEARRLLGRTNTSRSIIKPIRNGSIADFDMTVLLLKYFIRKAIGTNNLVKPHVAVSVPAGLDDVNRKALSEAVRLAGAGKVYLVEKPLAAALGSGLAVYDPVGSMVVDIGGGTTDVAVVSLGGLVVSQSIPVGGAKMDEAIINHIKREFSMLIGDRTAEDVKIDLASAMPLEEARSVRIRGRDLLSPRAMDSAYPSRQACMAGGAPCRAFGGGSKWVLERTPPELLSDIMQNGIYMTGRGSLLFAMDRYIATELGIPVRIARESGDCTALGLGYILENMALLQERGYMPGNG